MKFLPLTMLAVLALLPTAQAKPTVPPCYQFTAGQTLRYLIQRDPYFADPKAAIETATPDASYRPPVVERLTETVQAVAANGTATLQVTLAPEPGFEDENTPQPAITRLVTVMLTGKIVSVSGPALGDSPAERDLLRGIALLPPGFAARPDGLAVETHQSAPLVTTSTSPDHDGTLLQTTRIEQTDHLVFDCRQGRIEREISVRTITLSLVMTGRGRRGADDFGHVVPNVQVVQTLSIQRQPD